MSILLEAEGLINGDRQAAYGTPADNFGRWSSLCRASGRVGTEILSPPDLALVMVFGKLARETNGYKRDNIVDAAAYLEIYSRLVEGR